MQNLGKAMQDAITNLTDSSSEPHFCEFCQNLVPKLNLDFGKKKVTVQPRCKCEVENWERGITEAEERKQKNEIERKFAISSLGERFAESTFETFQPRSGTEKAFTYSRQFATTFPSYGGDALLLCGIPGNGKSRLAAAVCHEIKAKGYVPVFQSVPELLERIRSTFRRENSESEKGIMDALLHCDLLVLDDIGAEKMSDWVQDIMFRVIDGRYRNKKPIFYTSNLMPSELQEKLGVRIYDRVIETTIQIENTATSYRREVARGRMNDKDKDKRAWA